MREGSGRRRSRRFILAALLALGGLALGAGPGSLEAATADNATLTITYVSPTSLQVTLADGTVVKSGGTIPAGSYLVLVYDPAAGGDANPNTTINGPGVGLSSNLNSTGMGIDYPSTFGPYTFQTSSSYSVEDTNLGASSLITFATTATATASGGSGSGGTTTSSGGGSTGGGQSTTTTTSSSAGSKTSTMVGTLKGSVTASGKAALSFDGKAVKALKAGRYKVTAVDHSKKSGLIVGHGSAQPITISGAAAVGTSSRSITLSAGKWFFEASTHGPKTAFSVIT